MSFATKSPQYADIDPDVLDIIMRRETHYNGSPSEGLNVAAVLGALVLSYSANAEWNQPQLAVTVTELSETGYSAGELHVVRNASSRDNFDGHRSWVHKQHLADVASGEDLYAKRAKIYPNIRFAPRTYDDLRIFDAGNPRIEAVAARLSELDIFAEDWKEGAFDPGKLQSKVSPDSASTLKQYWRERTFRLEDGREHTFSWHLRATPGAIRVFFWAEDEKRCVHVGYIGDKLPTVSDPT